MNKIFKVVWSKTKNCYVVTSELAKNHTKNNQTKAETSAIGRFFSAAFISKRWNTMTVRAVVAALALTGLTGITFNVSAAYTDANMNPTSEHFVSVNFQPTTIYSGVAFNKDYKTFVTNVYTAYVNKIAQYETAMAQNVYNGTAIDTATLATYATDLQKYETDLLNLGYNQKQINALKVNNIKGITRTYDNGKLILTVDANAMKTSYADANAATGAVTTAQSTDTNQKTIDTATTTMLGNSNYDNNQAMGKQSIAIGFDALADGSSPNAVALGANTRISGSDSAVALGANNAIQKSKGALAMGNNVTISNSSGAIVFGERAGDWSYITNNAKESVAIGSNAYTSNAPYAVAIGSNARAFNEGGQNNGQESVAIGHNARTINMSYSIAIGSDAQASDKGHPSSGFNNSIAIGTVANANTSIDSVAIGHKAKVTNATDSIAFGREANVSGKTGALAIGSATTANSDYSISMGYNTTTNTNSTSSIAIGNKTSNNGKSSIAIGDNVSFTATSDESIVIGKNISLGGNTNSSIIIGESSSDGFYPSVKSENNQNMNYSVVIGAGAKVSDALLGTKTYYDGTTKTIGGSGEGTAVGNATWATGQAAAFGNNAYALGRSSIAIGNDDNAAYSSSEYWVSDYDGAHYFNKLYKAMLDQKKAAGIDVTNPENSVNGYILDKDGKLVKNNFKQRLKYSPTMALGEGAMAIGSRSMAYADNATAIGALTFAIGKGSTALGTLTRAEGAASMAMGNNSYVFANNAIASGTNSQVLSEGGNAYGYRTYAGGKNSLAVGSNAYANVKINFGTKDGHAVFDANGLYNSDPSRYAKSILTGADLKDITVNDKLITADGLNGNKSYLDNLDDLLTADTNPGLTTAKAETTTFHGVSGVVVAAKEEDDPNKNAENSIVIGNNAIATASNAIAMGKGAIITDDATNGMALGSYSMTTGRNSVALGLASRATGINSMAVGTASSANAENALSVGIAAINEGKNSSVIGFSSGVAHDSENSIIFGTNSVIDAGVTNSIVIGTGSSIGRYLMDDNHLLREINTEVGGVTGDSVESFKQVKTDENKKIDGAMAIGVNARVYNAESTTDSTATTRTSEEGKTLARENGNNAMAIGNGAEAWLENSVALGVNSETDYTPEQMAMVAWRTPGAVAASTDVNTGIISIGKKGMERRLVNVAAGAYDTDAVNVSQLMQLWDSIQREMNPIDLNNGVHFVATNFQQINSTPTTDYATKYGAQVTYDRFIRTLSEYKGYLIKAEYGGSTLTDKANTSYRKELTQLRNDLVNTYGISLDQLNTDSKLSNFYGTLTENTTDHLLQVNLDADGLHAKFALPEYALQDLIEARDADISVLTQDGNYITGMTSDALTAKLTEINYDNSQALTEGSIAIGYNARVGEKTTDNTGATAIKGQKGGVAIGYEARNMAETDNPNGASVALGDKSIVTEADATTTTKGVYYTNEAKDGITATPNAGVVSVGTSTEIKTADGITYNPSTRRIINVAAGALDTDAVNVSQLKSLAAQKIQLSTNGTTNNKTTDVAIGVDTGVVDFGIKGDGTDITTEASGTDVNIKLNKATTVEAGNNLAVTSDAVNTSITTVNNTIKALDGRVTTNASSIGTLNDQMAHTIGVTGNTTPAGTSNAKSLTSGDISFAITGDGTDITTTTTATGVSITVDKTGNVAAGDTKLVTGDTVNTAITNAKNAATTTLTEHADSPVTVVKTTAEDGHFNYNVTFNGTKAAEQIPLAYKANGANSTATSTVTLSNGLNFTNTDNLTASVEANGVVKYTLNKALTGISSISNTTTSGGTTTGTTIILSPTSNEVNVGRAKITGLANGSADSDAVTYGQFSNRKISLKGNSNSSTTEKTLANDVSFNIVGAEAAQGSTGPDITTAANGGNVTITLNKATSIASGNTQVATSGQVYDAVTKAKTKVAKDTKDTTGILTITPVESTDLTANNYTLGINQNSLITTVQDKAKLSYKAQNDDPSANRTTTLANGLDFHVGSDNNLTVTSADGGIVTYGLKSDLTGITSIAGKAGKDGADATKISIDSETNTITLSGKNSDGSTNTKLTGLADGENGSDAVNVSQLNNLKNKVGYENAVSSKTDKTPGAAGKDGLDGKDLGTQIAAIREGEAGPMVYTDGEGNRVVKDGDNFYTKDSLAGAEKAADGTYYNTSKLAEAGAKIENGKVVGTDGNEITDSAILEKVNTAKVTPTSVESKDVQISTVDPKTGEPKAPTTIGNVQSTLVATNPEAIKDPNKTAGDIASTAMTGDSNAEAGTIANTGLLKAEGSVLNNAATIRDLQTVANAGLTFQTNNLKEEGNEAGKVQTVHKALGETLNIEGKSGATYSDSDYSFDNMVTTVDKDIVRIGMKKSPEFTSVTLKNGTESDTNTVTLTPGKDSSNTTTLTLNNGKDSDNTGNVDTSVKITNVAAGTDANDAVNVSQLNDLKNKVGYDNAVSSKTDKTPGAAGKDGLDGKDLGTQIAAIREGEAGPMVYTDGEGNRVVKDGDNFYTKDSLAGAEKTADGTYYNTAKLAEAGAKIADGKVVGTDGNEITDPAILDKVNDAKVTPTSVESKDVQISAVDPKTGEPKAPTTIGNVKSTIGLDGNVGTDGKTPVIGEDQAKTNVSNLVKGDSKTSLNTVATVGDLQAVAQAGLDFKGNTGDAIHKALGSTLLIKGEENANFDDGSFESKNLATKNDNGTLRIGMKKTPTFDGVKVSNGTNAVELKPGEEANTLTLTNGTDGDNSAIKITNVAAGSNDTDAVNYSQLKDLIDKVGAENTNAGTDGKSPSTNPSGNDGLDGKDMGSQIQAIRDGEAGPMVYTDGEGNRVVKDGNTYYKKYDLVGMEKAGDSYYNIEALEKAGAKIVDGQIVNADGKVLEGDELKKVQDAAKVTTMPKAVDAKDVQISTVDPKTGEPKAPTTIGNVKSNYGYDGIGKNAEGVTKAIDAAHAKTAMDGEDGKSGLLNAKGADLNKVVTVGDLQAAAQAGLDFTTNDKVTDTAGTIHKALGSALAIEGKSGATYKDTEYGFDNMVTTIDGDKVRIGMKKAPEFTGVTLKDGTDSNANTVILTPGKDTNNRTTLNLTNGTDGKDNQVKITNIAAGTDANDAVNYSQLQNLDNQVKELQNGENGPMIYTDGEGNRLVKSGDTLYKASDLKPSDLVTKDGTHYDVANLPEGAKLSDDGTTVVSKDGAAISNDDLSKAKRTPVTSNVQISAVDPKTGEPKAPTTIGNVKSTIGLDGNVGTNGKTPVIGEDQAKANVSNLINGDSKTSLNTVATVGDLQAVAQAGLDFKGNTGDAIHKTLSSTLSIEGEMGANFDDGSFESKNLATKNDNGTLRIGMKKAPEFTSVTLKGGTDSDTNTVTLTPGKDTNDSTTTLTLNNGKDPKNTGNIDTRVKITNVAAGTDANDAVNYSQLQNLDNQVKELQNGENGPMVYTDDEGNRLVKSGDTLYKASDVKPSDLVTNDGTHYDATDLPEGAKLSDDGTTVIAKDGSAISKDTLSKAKLTPVTSNVQISAVDPTTGEPKEPTTIGNVKSNYGYNGIGTERNDKDEEVPAKGTDKAITSEDAKTAMNGVTGTDGTARGGLLNAKGTDLNKVATVGDLQAAAQAGLDFTTNDKVTTTAGTIHKTLGSTLAIEGKDGVTYNTTDYSFDNMVTTIDGDKVRIGMKKSPEFTGITLNDNSNKVVFAPGNDGAGNTSLKVSNGDTTEGADTRVVIDNIKDSESLNSAVTKGALDKAVEELHNREGVDNGTMVYTHEGKTLDRDGKNFYEKGSITPDKAEKIGTTFYSKDAMAKDGVTISVEGKVIDKDGNEITNPDILSNYQVKPVDPSTIEISTVDPATGEPKAPQTINSVKSNYGYNGIGTELNDKGEKVPAKGTDKAITPEDAKTAMNGVVGEDGTAKGGLLNAKGADLNKVATVGDLQAVAQAGLDFSTNNDKDNKEQTIHRTLGSKLSIKGKLDGQYGADYDSDNLVTTVADDNTIQIAMLRKPVFEGVTIENGKDGSNGKVDITAVPVNGKDATEGMTINLAGNDGKEGTPGKAGDGNVRISGVADGVNGNDAVNYSQLKDLIDKVGAANANAGSDAKSPANTPAGQDGLDGKDMGSQIQAIRDGEAGPMVYTDKDGNRLVNDGGTYYKTSDLAGMEKAGDSYYNTEALEKAGAKIVGGQIVDADGKVLKGDDLKKVQDAAKVTTMPKAVDANDVQISTVDPKTGEPKAPTTIGNVKSNYGYNGIGTEADGKTPAKGIANAITPEDAKTAMNGVTGADGTVTGGLLSAKGADLNKVVTVGDLQAAAQAGLDFTGNSKTEGKVDTAHTTLGGTIAIQGGTEYNANDFSDKNISTKVDPKTKTISINIKKKPEFDSVTLGQPGENGQTNTQVTIGTKDTKGGNEVNFASTHPQGGDTTVVLSGIKDDPTRRDTAITRGALEDLGILKGEVGPSHIAGSDVGGNLSIGDNLNDYSLNKQVQAQREGLSGNVVYTDAKGNRLVKAGNRFYSAAPLNKYILESKLRQDPLTGMWFNISDFDEDNKVKEEAKGNGLTAEQLAKKAGVSETQVSDIKLSAVNMSGNTNTPTEIGNIKSTIGLNKEAKVDANGKPVLDANGEAVYVGGPIKADAAKKAVVVTDDKGNVTGGLLNVKGSQLNTVATIGDLQAVAQAGLDITANANTENTNADPAKGEVSSKTPMHRTLGSQFAIKGSDNNDNSDFKTNFSTENIMTQVDGNIVRIGMKSSPVFKEVHFADNGSIKLGTNQNGNLTLTQNGATYEVATKNDGFYIKDANGNKTLVRINNEDAIEFNKYLTVTKADSKSDGASATGNTSTTGSTGSGTSTGENVNAGTTTGGNTTGASTSDTTPKAVGTVDVVVKDVPTEDGDIANKMYVDKQIGDIIKNFNTKNELEGQGTIATNTSTDKLAVSGVTVKQYLDDNYMTRPEINRRFTEVSKQANAGTAAAMAAAGIPQITNMYDDNLMIGAGVGSYGGESAVAIGVSGTNDDRDITYKIASTYDSRGKWGLSAGIGFSVGSGRDNPTKPERKTMSERIDRLTEENKELRKANEDTLKALDEANKNHLMSLEAANKAQWAQLQESGQAKIDVINATSQAKLDAMKKANEAELDALRKANKAELDKLRASNQAEIKSLTEKNNQLQQQVEKLEAMMNQLMAQNQAKETTVAPTTK
ncbi:ESPR-type extended signal peptide-containing protein [uncultured Veillonella sp.]|uniref:ESPR-type extended signal peptide-containing protein n=1 Tax=uncultured Veillonella sp. TaxID=159268 RepID=UPI002596CD53|nr:ESPR-type extended signal peptide-containing protein [uncultured Veillonella sp.]